MDELIIRASKILCDELSLVQHSQLSNSLNENLLILAYKSSYGSWGNRHVVTFNCVLSRYHLLDTCGKQGGHNCVNMCMSGT